MKSVIAYLALSSRKGLLFFINLRLVFAVNVLERIKKFIEWKEPFPNLLVGILVAI